MILEISLLMGLVTYLTRSIVFFFDFRIPKKLETLLKYIPFSVLSALIFPSLLIQGGEFSITLSNEYMIVGLITILIAVITSNTGLTIIGGTSLMVIVKVIT